MGVKHVESEPLVLHANIHHFGFVNQDDAFVERVAVETVSSLELELWLEEGERVLVTGAEDDGVNLGSAAVLEVAGFTVGLNVS